MLTDDLMKQEISGRKDVERFCKEYKVKLLSQGITDEFQPGIFEPIYFFSDNLGGYTIKGIRNSLE